MPPHGVLRYLPGRVIRSRPGRPLAARLCDWFAWATWLVLVVGGITLAAVSTGGTDAVANTTMTAVLSLAFLARLISTAVAYRERRSATGVLLLSLVFWAVASQVATAGLQPGAASLRDAGTVCFLTSYALMAVFLVLDTVDRSRVSLVTAVEATVTVGGAACLAGVLLLTPVSAQLQGEGVKPLLALLYPLLDLLLASAVLADLMMGRRAWSGGSRSLLAGFTLMAVADTTFGWNPADESTSVGVVRSLCWGVALTLIVAGACGPREEVTERGGPKTVVLPFAAAFVAMVVLALAPAQLRTLYLSVPAVITLLAAGARMILALREAQGAAEASRLSLTDELTDLPNRRALLARVQAEGGSAALALLLLDLDGFKEVNDTLGHVAGDHVLQQIAWRLRDQLDGGPLVARLGGDEFAVVLPSGDEPAALRVADRIRELVAAPLVVHGHTFLMGVSVGVAISRHRGTRSDLLRRADIAMYQAKTTRAGALMYDPDRDEFTTERLKSAEHLRVGIPAGQLRVWYQPQVQATSHRLTGAEALVRWEHPHLGLLPPAAFLAIARQTGLMPLLTETVLQLVLDDLRRWHLAGVRFPVSFNVAPPELLNAGLLERLLEQIDAARLPPNSLVLEVTEDSLMADPERARLALLEISRHQVEVAIDDYGTGFSSLSYLRDLPVHELKLDQSFISTVRSDPRSRIIVASTNQMAQGLGLRTVAEGVEDAEIAETVRELGIDVLQGYHIARPMPAEQLLPWLSEWQESLTSLRPH